MAATKRMRLLVVSLIGGGVFGGLLFLYLGKSNGNQPKDTRAGMADEPVKTANSAGLKHAGEFNADQADLSSETSAEFSAELFEKLDSVIEKADKGFELELHLRDREKVDPELFSKWEMPESDIASASSHDLLAHFADTPIATMFGAYDDTNLGIERVLRSSRTLKAFVERSDMAEGLARFYVTFPYSPESVSKKDREDLQTMRVVMSDHANYEPFAFLKAPEGETRGIIGKRSMQLHRMDQLSLFPKIFQRLKGHEKPLLEALAGRFHAIENVRLKHGDGAYSAASGSGYRLSLALLRSLEPAMAERFGGVDFQTKTWEKEYYRSIETHLGLTPGQ